MVRIYLPLERYTDFLFLWGHLSNIFRDYFFTSISLYELPSIDHSSFLTQIIVFMLPKTRKLNPLNIFHMLKQTFLNNFLHEVAKNLGYDGTIKG